MPFVTPNMSLKVWNASNDPYDHEQLADNFFKLDLHDHSQGRGAQISGAGIQSGAITADHIYPGTLDGSTLANQSIESDQLANSSVTNAILHINARVPIGTVVQWYNQAGTPLDYLPDGWRLLDGAVVLAADHEIPGVVGNLTLPNETPFTTYYKIMKVKNA